MAGAQLLVDSFVTVLIFLLGKQVDAQTPSIGLYFILNDNVHLPGASVNLSDIGSESGNREAGSTLRCITTNVNIGCCRPYDNTTHPVPFGGFTGQWLYPNNTVVPRPSESSDFTRRGHFQEVRLTVESNKTAGPPGSYTCTVPNGNTGEPVNASIILANSPPAMPASVAHSSVQSTQVTLTWTSRPSDSVNTYTINYVNTGSECTLDSRATEMTAMTSITITGLEENTQYQFSITATNNFGMSSAAVDSTSTQPSIPTGSPQLTLQSRTATSFTVTWSRETCLSRNGPDMHYTVRYFMTGTTAILETQNVAINSRTYTADGLRPATSYTIQMEYVNTVGSGPTTALEITTLGYAYVIPSIPTNFGHSSVLSTQVTLSWSSPSTDVVNMYTISYSRGGCSPVLSDETTTAMNRITISNLEEDRPYEFRVTATNNAGISHAAVQSITTQSAVPTGTPQLMLQSHTATNFTVTWTRESCLSRNGPGKYYTVRYFVTGTTVILETQNVAIDSRTYTANLLTPATSYTIQVEYVNKVGSGPTTALDITTLGYEHVVPSIPTNFGHSSVLSTQVTLSWSSPSTDVVNMYTISYSRIGGCSNVPSNETTTAMTEITIPGLEENIQYEFRVTATNNIGTSQTAVHNITTQSAVPTEAPQLILQSRTATSCTVTWNRETCLSRNGPDRNYAVTYFVTGTTQILGNSNVGIDIQMFTINTLNPVTSYTVEVSYVNTVGSSPKDSLTISTFGLPFHGYQNRVAYPNNSIVTLTDIGLDVNALVCYTDLSTCCRNEDTPNEGILGYWQFPNGSLTIGRGTANMNMFFRDRNKQAILLHRGSNAFGPSGIFTCNVPDVNMRQRRVYFGIYPIGKGFLNVQSISYDSSTGIVNCISVGGPVTDLTWNRNGQSYQQSKIIVDTVNATYHNLLYLSTLSDYTGIFSCTVSNSRGSASRMTEEFKSIGLSGDRATYDTGSTASVICFTNLSVVSVQWLNSSADISFSTERIKNNELILNIEDTISQGTHGTSFTCEVKYLLLTEEYAETIVFTIRTTEEVSGLVSSFFISPTSDSIVQISWMPPDSPNGIITAYYLKLVDLKIDNVLISTNINSSETTYTQTGLVAGVPYEVNVSAINSIGLGKNTSDIFFTKELQPLESPVLTVTRTSASMTLIWTPLTLIQARGFVMNYTILYYTVSDSKKRQQPNTMSITIASNITHATIDDLDENSVYSVQIAANNEAGSGPLSMPMLAQLDTSASGNGFTTIIAIVVAIVLAAIAVVAIFTVVLLIMKSRRNSKFAPTTNELVMYSKGPELKSPMSASPQKPSNNGTKMSSKEMEANSGHCDDQTYENTAVLVKDRLKPVLIEEFGAHVCRMHADRDKWFEMEYNSIEKSAKVDYKTAVIPENRARNRFGNIYPYDFNRVLLSTIPDVDYSDYINASYVDGYGRKNVYIAAQGPMDNSVDDFWRMIWERKCPTIVMLTKVFEGKKKCEKYWPESTSEPFMPCSESSFVIELKSSLPFPEFVIKKMTVTKIDNPGSPIHDVTLFHYLGWPDHGVPANAISMINFIRRVRKSHPYSNTDLMVVHCSAGVGRTGTFITLDYMLKRIKTDTSINIYEYITGLRKQRVLMVQTLAQYVFIHNALDELLTCGDTEVAAADMRIIIGRLSRPVEEGSDVSGFQRQYEVIYETLTQVTSEIQELNYSQSKNAANTNKNRYEDKIPFNHARVILRPAATHGSDYINASFVEGYRQNGAYIATQGPLPHTVNDFWRMIWEQECHCIVMLCKAEENEKEVCHRYWPQGKGISADYGRLTVAFKDQKAFSDYVLRKLEISDNQSRMSVSPTRISITQFQYLRWQEDTVPNSTSAILEIANLVQKVQMSTGNKPIVVMCNDGVGRSGTFISVHAQMERMKSEGVIDVFQFIKSVRFQRAGLVANKEQYEFCHQTLADFLDGFDTYANFKEII